MDLAGMCWLYLNINEGDKIDLLFSIRTIEFPEKGKKTLLLPLNLSS